MDVILNTFFKTLQMALPCISGVAWVSHYRKPAEKGWSSLSVVTVVMN